MTTTVTVRTRAWPAVVAVKTATEGQEGHNIEEAEHRVEPRSSLDIQVSKTTTLTVTEVEPPQEVDNSRPFVGEVVPGAAENDALLGQVAKQPASDTTRFGKRPAE